MAAAAGCRPRLRRTTTHLIRACFILAAVGIGEGILHDSNESVSIVDAIAREEKKAAVKEGPIPTGRSASVAKWSATIEGTREALKQLVARGRNQSERLRKAKEIADQERLAVQERSERLAALMAEAEKESARADELKALLATEQSRRNMLLKATTIWPTTTSATMHQYLVKAADKKSKNEAIEVTDALLDRKNGSSVNHVGKKTNVLVGGKGDEELKDVRHLIDGLKRMRKEKSTAKPSPPLLEVDFGEEKSSQRVTGGRSYALGWSKIAAFSMRPRRSKETDVIIALSNAL